MRIDAAETRAWVPFEQNIDRVRRRPDRSGAEVFTANDPLPITVRLKAEPA